MVELLFVVKSAIFSSLMRDQLPDEILAAEVDLSSVPSGVREAYQTIIARTARAVLAFGARREGIGSAWRTCSHRCRPVGSRWLQ
jgi:hypothetical protein